MAFLVALFAIAASCWTVPVVRSGRVPIMIAIVLVLGTVLSPFFFAIEGPIQISIDRIAWGGLLVVLVVQWRLGRIELPSLGKTDVLMVALTGFMLLSSQQGGDPPGTSSPLARWLFYVMMPAGTYAMARVIRLRRGDVPGFMTVWIILAVYLAVTGLLEAKNIRALVFPRYINDPAVWEFYGRGRGPLLNPIANGVIIGGALMATAIRMWNAARDRQILYAAVSLVLLGGVYATLTRSCWVGAIGGLGCIAWLYLPRWARIWSVACLAVLAIAMSMGLKDQLLAMKRDKDLSAAEAAKSVELRPLLAVVAWEMFKDSPIRGHGFGHYFEHNGPYHNARGYDLPLEKVREYMQHNTFLGIAVDGGIIGLSLLVSILASFGWAAYRIVRDRTYSREALGLALLTIGFLWVYFANAMFHDLIVIPMVQMFLMALGGLVVAVSQTRPT